MMDVSPYFVNLKTMPLVLCSMMPESYAITERTASHYAILLFT